MRIAAYNSWTEIHMIKILSQYHIIQIPIETKISSEKYAI